jgi:AGCS family alanine or glycine:cation symporter
MGLLYVVSALILVVLNLGRLPSAIADIVKYAFSPPGMVGGFAGSTFVCTLTWGIKRGLFSNEAGQGSAPIAHAAARTDRPVREGSVALLEPFVDTVVICFITGLVIVLMGTWNQKYPDRFDISAKSGLTWIKAGREVGRRGTVGAAAAFNGNVEIVDGRPAGVQVVRNHSVVDDMVLTSAGRRVNGTLKVEDGLPTVRDKDDAKLPPFKVFVEGKCLLNGSPLTAIAFKNGLEPIFPYGNFIITITVFLFAISTAISWSYYGDRAILYLAGHRAVMPYKVIYTIVHFVGAVVSLEMVWSFGDAALGLMAIPNLIAVLLLSKSVRDDSKMYFAEMDAEDAVRKLKSSGKV